MGLALKRVSAYIGEELKIYGTFHSGGVSAFGKGYSCNQKVMEKEDYIFGLAHFTINSGENLKD